MKKFLLAAAAVLCLFGPPAKAQVAQGIGAPNTTASLNITTATTTKAITGSSVRAADITMIAFVSGAAGTVQFEYGSGSNCGTGTTVLSGAFTVAALEYQFGDGYGSLFIIPAGKDFCIVTTSTATVVGFVDYNEYVGSL